MKNFFRAERPSSRTLAAYLAEEVTATEGAQLEDELAASSEARRRLQQLRDIRDLLGAVESECTRIDVAPAVLRALAEPPRQASRTPALRVWSAYAAVSCVALCVFLGAHGMWNSGTEFRSKAIDAAGEDAAKYSVSIYQSRSGEPAKTLGSSIKAQDGLLFSYTNTGARPFEFLMIFGVDSSEQVHWYYPFFDRPGTDPSALPISRQATPLLLPDVIEHELPPGPMQIKALFSHRALRVSEVEAWLRRRDQRDESSAVLDVDSRLITTPVPVEP